MAKSNSVPDSLDSVVTRDANGNGYLDEIELYFNKPVTFPPGFSLADFSILHVCFINYQVVNVPFTVESAEAMDTSRTKFVLHLAEDTTALPGWSQTSWMPYVNINGLANPVAVAQCNDGAGPVIWSVTKTVVNVSDRRQDVVKVIFSEPVQDTNGSPLMPATLTPGLLFIDYRKNGNGTWDTINMFDSINSFDRIANDITLEFKMSNGKDLTENDYININTSANKIYDGRSLAGGGAGVPPVRDNRKAQVKVIFTSFPDKLVIVPDPSWPTNMREKPGYFYLTNNPHARDWVRIDASGIVISFSVFINADDSTLCSLKIFDSFGSEIASAEPYNGSYLKDIAAVSSAQVSDALVNVDIYWNGTTTKLPVEYVHEGMYRAEFQFQRKNEKNPTILKQDFYMKKTDVGHSTCGGNVSIAFVPAIWLKTRRPLLRIIKNILTRQKRW